MTGEDDLRERSRQQMLAMLGGWSGTVVAGLPPVVFVITNAVTGLRAAVIAAITAGLLMAAYRLARRQPLQQAVTGLFGVLVAAVIAERSGQARNYFVLGIVTSFVYAGAFAVSLLMRRPLAGVAWEFLDPTPLPSGTPWFRVRKLVKAYDSATIAALAVFTLRAVVQLSLFNRHRTGWLAVARIAMGYPLYLAVIAFAFWVVRRARAALPRETPSEGGELTS